MPWQFYDRYGNAKQAAANVANPTVKVVSSTGQAIPSGARTMFTAWTAAVIDTIGSMWSAGNPSRLVAPVAGKYLIEAVIDGGSAGSLVEIYKNAAGAPLGTNTVLGMSGATSTGPGANRATLVAVASLNAGDYVELMYYHASGSAQTCGANGSGNTDGGTGFEASHFAMTKIDGAVAVPVAYPAALVGQEVAYTEVAANIACPASTLTTVITGAAFTADGVSAYLTEIFVPQFDHFQGSRDSLYLYDNGVLASQISTYFDNNTGAAKVPLFVARRLVPSAGSHQYSFRVNGTGAGTARGVTDDVGAVLAPIFIRTTKAT